MGRLLLNHRTGPVSPDAAAPTGVLDFHRRLAGYEPTALVELPHIAGAVGVGRLLVKAETERFGLPAFKALGASWATYRVLVEQIGFEPEWSSWAELADAVAEELGPLRFVAATDGNHGRAVAWVARSLRQAATILVPEGTAQARIDGIASEGAEVRVVAGTYDDAVAASAALASPVDLVISDTSWPGYEDVPRAVIQGYSTIFSELDTQLEELGGWAGVDIIVVPLGVGALGAAAVAHLRAGRAPGEGPYVLGVEPIAAACCLAALDAGHVVEVPGPHRSIMAGLNCGMASMLALPSLMAGFDAIVAISDDRCRDAMRALAGAGLDVGETGAASVGALAEVREAHAGALPVPPEATALVLATEGVTDPANFETIVGRPPRPPGFRT